MDSTLQSAEAPRQWRRRDQMITLYNDFHGSEVTLRANPGDELSLAQVRRARRELCGISGCLCGGNLGERGRQDVEIVPIGYHNNNTPRIRVLPLSGVDGGAAK